MRVQYTLPGFIPTEAAPPESVVEGSPFRSRLSFAPAPPSLSWERLLGLDQVPTEAASIGPPPRPDGLEPADVPSERLRWRQMLDRHLAVFTNGRDVRATQGNEPQVIERMLALLMRYQELEDSITARHLSEPEA